MGCGRSLAADQEEKERDEARERKVRGLKGEQLGNVLNKIDDAILELLYDDTLSIKHYKAINHIQELMAKLK